MQIKLLTLSLILFLFINAHSQTIKSSYELEFVTPGTTLFGLGRVNNPAEIAFQPQPNFYFTWSNPYRTNNSLSNWGIFTSVPYLGFEVYRQSVNDLSVTDYKVSTAIGSDEYGLGFGYSWSNGDVNNFNHFDFFTLGAIYRPLKYFSFNLVANLPHKNENEFTFGAGFRPFSDYGLTFFGDYTLRKNESSKKLKWSAGAVVEPLDGLRLIGRYFDREFFHVGVQLGFGSIGLTANAHYNDDAKYSFTTYGIRVGAKDRNLLNIFSGKNNYVAMDLIGGIKYQNFKLFDNGKTLFNLIEQLDAVKNDNTVSGIALNLSGANINREIFWELREKLKEIKSIGKKVYIYLDRAGMDEYHFASVADKIILDPMGTISLNGFLMGRTFYKGSLEKIGLGFRELRYFKYKSAAESYVREDFSEADREQRQRLVDENYNLAQKDICEGRNFSPKYFDELVDSAFIFLPDEAVKLKLVDTLARWSDINEIINKYEKQNKDLVSVNSLNKFNTPDDYWGPKPKVAVIYAIGGTEMDNGIKARTLVQYVETAMNSEKVKAIVLRVDSPGGDALAADLIADVLRKGKGKKPIIVSQGYVAASGGYWLSMFADTIVAAPNTITGSIGVIGAFLYNKNLKQELGMSVDHVQKGKFADLGFGATFPLINLTLPDRDFTDEELKISETGIKTLYKEFVEKVAAGRNKTFDDINQIAQGRVWSGKDGLNNGLVDVLGGLGDAIKIALVKSGLTNKEYEIVELPEREWFDFSSLIPNFLKIEQKIVEDPFIRDLKFRLQYNGLPIPLLPVDFIDENMIFEED